MGTITLIYYHRLLCWRLLAWLSEIAPNTRFKRRSITPTPHPQILRLVNTLCCQSTKHRREIIWKLQQYAIMKGTKHYGMLAHTQSWIHTPSIVPAALTLLRHCDATTATSTATATWLLQPRLRPMTSGFLYCWIRSIAFLLLSLYLHGWSDKRKSLEGWRNQCVTSEAISSLMHKRGTCTRSSNDHQVRKSGNIFDCCIVILITSQWSRHSVHANCLYIADLTDIEIIDGHCCCCVVVGLLT